MERLSRRREDFFVAIISGRAVSNVKEMAGVEVWGLPIYDIHIKLEGL